MDEKKMTDLNSFLINSVTALEWTASVLDKINNKSGNTAGGFAVIGEDGKLPSDIIPEVDATSKWIKAVLNQADFSNTDETYGGSYKELDGICSVEVYDAEGYQIAFDIKCDFNNSKTRIYIPSSLSAETIVNWTLLYLKKVIV